MDRHTNTHTPKQNQNISTDMAIFLNQKRDLETRDKEHFRSVKNEEREKSAVAALVWWEKHAMDDKPVLLKHTSNNWKNILI